MVEEEGDGRFGKGPGYESRRKWEVVAGGEFGGKEGGNESRRLRLILLLVMVQSGEGGRGGGEMERNGDDSWRVLWWLYGGGTEIVGWKGLGEES